MDAVRTVAEQLDRAGISCRAGEPMSRHTTFRIGGEAALFCIPKDEAQLCGAVKAARAGGLPYLLLGKGSNLLFCDKGYTGLIIHTAQALAGIRAEGGTLSAGAGETLEHVCEAAQRAGLSGLEFAYGIPGTVGGAVYMNAGAYGGEMAGVVHSVRAMDEDCRIINIPAGELGLGYRTSVFHTQPWCVLEARFALRTGPVEDILGTMRENMRKRREKQPLDLPSAGSAFKRPAGAFAGALIDQCGLRGYQVGGAAISEKHCGFIVNLGGATCGDVLRLAEHVQNEVLRQTGFVLEREICVVGACP